MTRLRFVLVTAATALVAAGCQPAAAPVAAGPAGAPTIAGSTGVPTTAGPMDVPATARPSDGPITGPAPAPSATARTAAAPRSPYRVTYGWAVPSRPVRVSHDVKVPVAPPPAVPLPLLVEVRAADHPEENFSRITFAFRGGIPSYEVGYVPSVPTEGTGEPLPLAGNAFVRIVFTPAQAHDEKGRPTVAAAPHTALRLPTLRGYGFGGDFEGYVTFGLGLQLAPNSDQVLPVRLGELVRSDGTHVVAVDVRRS
jgi:hypothetical protein